MWSELSTNQTWMIRDAMGCIKNIREYLENQYKTYIYITYKTIIHGGFQMIWDLCACCRWQWRVDWPPCAELQIRTSWLSDDANPKVEDSSARRIYIYIYNLFALVSRSKLFDLNKLHPRRPQTVFPHPCGYTSS